MCDANARSPFRPGPAAALFAASMVLAVPATAATLTWNNVNADWTVGTNWTPGGPPGAGDVAVVNGGNPQLNSDTAIQGLNQGGGTISGTGTLTVTGPSIWTTGIQSGTGTDGITDSAFREGEHAA